MKEFKAAYEAYEETGNVPMIEAPEELKQLTEGIGKCDTSKIYYHSTDDGEDIGHLSEEEKANVA